MPIPVPTRFTKFEFSEKEYFVATRFTEMNLMLIQTMLAEAAEELTNLKIDLLEETTDKESAVLLFAQRQAELIGKIGAYENLILLSTDTKEPVAPKTEVQTPDSKGT